MLRLDKFLCEMNIGSRSQVKLYLKQGLVTVNGETITKPETKVNENKDEVAFRGESFRYRKYVYYMLNKPKDVVSATKDNLSATVTDLLKDTGYVDLFPVGRLDKDTEGLLLMTNDGALAHDLLSPKKHVKKVYFVILEHPLTAEDVCLLEAGVDIGEEERTRPASVELLPDKCIYLTITEGKFHQVKRMINAVDNNVLYLKRVSVGSLRLDEELKPGEYRELTQEEIQELKQKSI
ncbi:16S rRNA pseudouridine516 synthase [Kineothrix alysoides]|uniref:Pseudouridine synthase n=1 Tax=Kineothrix alysoides TaxID=1469948 RepID=A0A4R1QZR7_9FIRM|nr:pseudouridine synthase [Kineothrix alysoides]TCL58491.1 16S rRNA pseudouridine516 synthase [Kineothrix alysoides]